MLDLVNCKVLSVLESEHVDAYLLSESSMFVFPHKLVLKTCGTTTLLCGLSRMLEIAALSAKFPHVAARPTQGVPAAATPHRVFYSRKNYLNPDQQRGPHRSWRDEVRALDKLFTGGSAYMIGKMNGEHWYLYITGPDTRLTPPTTPENETFPTPETTTKLVNMPLAKKSERTNGDLPAEAQDETLEILMTDLDVANAKQFYLDHATAVAEGRFYRNARSARKAALGSLGTIPEQNENSKPRSCPTHDDFDVFEQTSSDHSGFSSSEEDDLTFPQELTTEGHALGTVVSEASGLADVYPIETYPGARIDAYLFTPCGFSANGVVPASSGEVQGGKGCSLSTHYFTVHVTPEPHCSYASFETNVPTNQTGRQTGEIIEQVVNIFKPGRFSVTLFEAKPDQQAQLGGLGKSLDAQAIEEFKRAQKEVVKKASRMENIAGYRRVDRIVHDLEGYELVFRYYERHDWKGDAPPRLGEVPY